MITTDKNLFYGNEHGVTELVTKIPLLYHKIHDGTAMTVLSISPLSFFI